MSDQNSLQQAQEEVVTFSFKKREPIHIELDLNAITWEDNLRFSRVQTEIEAGRMTEEEGARAMTELLSKLAGQDVSKLPSVVVTQLLVQFKKMSEVRDEEAKNSN